MLPFEKLQESFYDAIFGRKGDLTQEIKSDHADERIKIYRITIVEALKKALSITFPGFWALVGKECADSVSYSFCQNQDNLPHSGCLDEWGEDFPSFVGTIEELKHIPYLEDYLRFEWTQHLAYRAATADPLSPEKLSQLTEKEIDTVRFTLVPSFHLFESHFPIQAIHEVATNPDAEPFDLKKVHTYLCLIRLSNKVEHFGVDKPLWDFCNHLKKSFTLMEAADKIQENHPDFNLTDSLHFLLHNQFLTDKLSFERKYR